MKQMIAMIRMLRGRISEPLRSKVAVSLAGAIGAGVPEEHQAWWVTSGRASFLIDCGIEEDPQTTPDEISVEPTKLALFINKWRAVRSYKIDGEFQPLTQELACLIATMTEDLEDLAVELPTD